MFRKINGANGYFGKWDNQVWQTYRPGIYVVKVVTGKGFRAFEMIKT